MNALYGCKTKNDQMKYGSPLAQELVEYVLVLPCPLLLVLGAMDFGCMFFLDLGS